MKPVIPPPPKPIIFEKRPRSSSRKEIPVFPLPLDGQPIIDKILLCDIQSSCVSKRVNEGLFTVQICVTLSLKLRQEGCLVVNMLGCDVIVSEFEHYSRFYFHFRTKTPGKVMNPLITPGLV